MDKEEEVLKPLELTFFKGWREMTDEEKLLWLRWRVAGLERKMDIVLSWLLGVPKKEILPRLIAVEEELEKRVKALAGKSARAHGC